MSIELLAFDIGGVFSTRNRQNINPGFTHILFDHDFLDLQRGKIKAQDFLAKKNYQLGLDKYHFENLVSTHENIRLLKKLTCNYIFASNINSLHYEKFIREAQPSLFAVENSVLSYELGHLKPEAFFFECLKNINKITPLNILFIDDKLENINTALASGLSARLCTNPEALPKLLKTFTNF